jgi:hypothetical protein
MFGVLDVLHLFCVFDPFCLRIFEFWCLFECLMCFFGFSFVFGLFSGQIKIFGLVYGLTKIFRSTWSNKKNWVKGFNTLFGFL